MPDGDVNIRINADTSGLTSGLAQAKASAQQAGEQTRLTAEQFQAMMRAAGTADLSKMGAALREVTGEARAAAAAATETAAAQHAAAAAMATGTATINAFGGTVLATIDRLTGVSSQFRAAAESAKVFSSTLGAAAEADTIAQGGLREIVAAEALAEAARAKASEASRARLAAKLALNRAADAEARESAKSTLAAAEAEVSALNATAGAAERHVAAVRTAVAETASLAAGMRPASAALHSAIDATTGLGAGVKSAADSFGAFEAAAGHGAGRGKAIADEFASAEAGITDAVSAAIAAEQRAEAAHAAAGAAAGQQLRAKLALTRAVTDEQKAAAAEAFSIAARDVETTSARATLYERFAETARSAAGATLAAASGVALPATELHQTIDAMTGLSAGTKSASDSFGVFAAAAESGVGRGATIAREFVSAESGVTDAIAKAVAAEQVAEVAREKAAEAARRRIAERLALSKQPGGGVDPAAYMAAQREAQALAEQAEQATRTATALRATANEAARLATGMQPAAVAIHEAIAASTGLGQGVKSARESYDAFTAAATQGGRSAAGVAKELGIELQNVGHHAAGSSGLIRELLVNAREIGRGDFTRLAGSLTLTAQYAGLLKYALNPVVLGLGAFAATMVEGIVQAEHFNRQLGSMEVALASSGRTAELTRTQFREMISELSRLPGVTHENAEALLQMSARHQGIAVSQYQAIGEAAAGKARVDMTSVEDAERSLLKSYDDGYAGVMRLAASYNNYLTPAQYKAIQDAHAEGDAIKVRNLAIEASERYFGKLVHEGVTPLSESLKGLSNSWHSMTEALGDSTAIQFAITSLTGLINAVTALTHVTELAVHPWETLKAATAAMASSGGVSEMVGVGSPGPEAAALADAGKPGGKGLVGGEAGTLSSVLAEIRKRESGGNYGMRPEQNMNFPISHASGAYQFQPATWQEWAGKSGIGQEFKEAYQAPPNIQDAVAAYAATHGPGVNSRALWGASSQQGGKPPYGNISNVDVTPEQLARGGSAPSADAAKTSEELQRNQDVANESIARGNEFLQKRRDLEAEIKRLQKEATDIRGEATAARNKGDESGASGMEAQAATLEAGIRERQERIDRMEREHGSQRVAIYEQEWRQKQVSSGNFYAHDEREHIAFLEQKKAEHAGEADVAREIDTRIYELKKTVYRQDVAEFVAGVKAKQSAEHDNLAAVIADQDAIIAKMRETYGADSVEFKNAMREKEALMRQMRDEQFSVSFTKARSTVSKDTQGYAERKADLDAEVATYTLSKSEETAILLAEVNRRQTAELASLAAIQQAYQLSPKEFEQVEELKTQIVARAEKDRALLRKEAAIEARKEMQAEVQVYDNAFSQIGSGAKSAFDGLITGSSTWADAEKRLIQSVLSAFGNMILEMVARWAAMAIAENVIGEKWAVGYVQQAQRAGQSGLSVITQAFARKVGLIHAETAAETTGEQAKTIAAQTGALSRAGVATMETGRTVAQVGQQVASVEGGELAKTGAVEAGEMAKTAAKTASSATGMAAEATDAASSITTSAAKAAAGAYGAISGIPYVGPFLAPIAAATVFAAAIAFKGLVGSAEGGWGEVPQGGAIGILHSKEMVLPRDIADPLRSQARQGFPASISPSWHAAQVGSNMQNNSTTNLGGVNGTINYAPVFHGVANPDKMKGFMQGHSAQLNSGMTALMKNAAANGAFARTIRSH